MPPKSKSAPKTGRAATAKAKKEPTTATRSKKKKGEVAEAIEVEDTASDDVEVGYVPPPCGSSNFYQL